ncbi:hypothetical protein HMP0721_1847 [Pseudoramibacter alactolyticus ATCC 23263]|uniref:DUF951 domain-containing protein n=1 Tax=Pseudoramibacter alactolyticus ATCC 23263 TaxID=887929 RepID=E6MIL2_9FIRM|nr:DUF951 domain-containing protein [Pseudoramibacter alactolyticus]EFV01108.1 hypothetical protein HMP0721_1847 [Pseudoramibacter alactolyticus ATCC 23263]
MEKKQYALGDIVMMKKQHPCGTNAWEIIRMGADIKIRCTGCGHIVMLPRQKFERMLKKILEAAEEKAE